MDYSDEQGVASRRGSRVCAAGNPSWRAAPAGGRDRTAPVGALDDAQPIHNTRHMSFATSSDPPRRVVLVKHALPVLEADVPARDWRLGAEGEAQARQLAARLRSFVPFELRSSSEPKARRTAEIVASELALATSAVAGLDEFDRPALPILPASEHAALNARIFSDPERRVLGRESAAEALQRFSGALSALLAAEPSRDPLVIVTHGTMISLFVAAHSDVDGFQLWRELSCPSFVVLTYRGFALVSGVERVA
jgi:broad specificity phosphatase PhoE